NSPRDGRSRGESARRYADILDHPTPKIVDSTCNDGPMRKRLLTLPAHGPASGVIACLTRIQNGSGLGFHEDCSGAPGCHAWVRLPRHSAHMAVAAASGHTSDGPAGRRHRIVRLEPVGLPPRAGTRPAAVLHVIDPDDWQPGAR